MIFEKIPRGAGKFNSFTVNGKSYPHDQEFMLKQGTRYRLTFHNRTDDAHPLHLHRHQLESRRSTASPHPASLKIRSWFPPMDAPSSISPPTSRGRLCSTAHPAPHGLRLQGAFALRLTRPGVEPRNLYRRTVARAGHSPPADAAVREPKRSLSAFVSQVGDRRVVRRSSPA